MDMTRFNDDIRQASDEPVDDGPRFPDGDYVMAVVDHEEKNKYEIPGTDPVDYRQIGIWVTFKICEGEFKGKDYMQYYGMRHPTSKVCVRYGQSDLKKLYRSVNFMPSDFSGIYGKRFVGSLESKKQDDIEFPWSTKIADYAKAPQPQGQSFDQTIEKTAQGLDGQVVNQHNIGQVSKESISDIPF